MEFLIFIPILFTALVLHEYAHGWVAFKLGDPTAKMAGRLSLNPMRHIDPFGTIILPGILIFLRSLGSPIFPIGWAKPVPVDFRYLRHPRSGIIMVGMAGPAMNILLAFLASFLMQPIFPLLVLELIRAFIVINVLLAVFNMIPVPPLDGSRLVMGLLPPHLARQYAQIEPFGIIIVIALLSVGVFDNIIIPVTILVCRMMGVPIS